MTLLTDKKMSLQQELAYDLKDFLKTEKEKYPENELLRIDLHCHDYNSNVPDELMGRILNVPETWLPTENLIKTLRKNNSDVITITNHNNARSCFELQDKGVDVLVGTEFSCYVPDFNVGIHVLTFGFTREQEKILNKLRKNIYQFLQFTNENDIPTIWAHPLYHYSTQGTPEFDFFSKMALVFERFEVLNGQRDTWQNMLVKTWLESITPEQIDADAERFKVDISLYCKNRYKKSYSGGSDSHMGIFSGQTGTSRHIPNLEKRRKKEKLSDLALEAIKNGAMIPYGTHQNSEKLTVAFVDYVCQIAMYKEDPGLLRILLHKGTAKDKVFALLVSNAFSEVSRNKKTMRFVSLFHDCLTGKVPSKSKRLLLPKVYKPIFDDVVRIAKAHTHSPEKMIREFSIALNSMSTNLNNILFSRLTVKINDLISENYFQKLKLADVIEQLEIPSDFRALFQPKSSKKNKNKKLSKPDFSTFFDGITFPLFTSTILLGANFTSSKVLYNTRPLLNDFSERFNKYKHPKRMLWLTDTYEDKNGVSGVLQDMHKEIKRRNLPIDILVCSNTVIQDDHLIVIKPLAEFEVPFYKQQPIRIPDFNEIHHLFLENEYDRIMCSTEGVMGLVGLYLKNAYTLPAHFYVHTDWLVFARKTMNLDMHNMNRIRRFLRAYYNGFDKLFVLNSDHKKWLTSIEMNFKEENVNLTAHWNNEAFYPRVNDKGELFKVKKNEKILLYVGRFSLEKGLLDIIDIYESVKSEVKNLRMVFVGEGPEEKMLKEKLPNAIFLGWKNKETLAKIYSSADLLILPSKYDTFSCVVLEALSCGLPVTAYKSKGPKDIIEHRKSGFLSSGKNEMQNSIITYFSNPIEHDNFRLEALQRSEKYDKELILNKLMEDVGLEY